MVLFYPLIEIRKSYNYMVNCDMPCERDHHINTVTFMVAAVLLRWVS